MKISSCGRCQLIQKVHAAVWPAVLATLRKAQIVGENASICDYPPSSQCRLFDPLL